MFSKTIRGIQSSRQVNINYPMQPQNNGYNTQRQPYQRYTSQLPVQQQQDPMQRRTLTSDHFHQQLKKGQNQNKPVTSELVIRQCDVNQLNLYKKNTPRQAEEQNSYQFNSSASKRQKLGIGSRKTYDSNYRQPLKQYFLQRQNIPRNSQRNERYSSNTQMNSGSIYDFQDQFQNLKQYVFQVHQQYSNQLKKNKNQTKNVRMQCMSQLQNIANQISKQLTKQKQQIYLMNKNRIQTQKELKYLKQSFNSFVKDNQQKIQSIVLDLHGNKKSKNMQQFGIDLKSSSSHCISGGVGTSMSMNFQNQNVNFKLYNQMSAQMQLLKNQLQKTKQKIQILDKDTKTIELTKKASIKQQESRFQNKQRKIDLKQVQRLIIAKFQQQSKKNLISDKLLDLDLKTKDLYRVYQDMDSNIKGMNAQFTRVINGTVIKKQKMLQAKVNVIEEKLTQIFDKINPLNQTIKQQFKSLIEQKSSNFKVIKTRLPTLQQKSVLENIKQSNNLYLIDQEGFLMDRYGAYILQEGTKGKNKIKIQKDLYYLLQCQGIEIKSI